MILTIGTPTDVFLGGTVYDLPPDEARSWINAGAAKPSSVPPAFVAELLARLTDGAGKPCVFLPSIAEFGHRVMSEIRIVHWHKASRKVVCCRRGEEVLYPSADAFFTDWVDPVDDSVRGGCGHPRPWPDIERRFPGHHLVETTGGITHPQSKVLICPGERIPFKPKLRGLHADVCLGIRDRAFCKEKNWPAWQFLADAIAAAGYSFAVIGQRPTTLDLAGQKHHSSDFDTDAAIELIQNCRLYVGSDTGTSHLAATIGADMLVFRQEWTRNGDYRPYMAERNPGRVESMPPGTWSDPDAVVARTLQKLNEGAR